MIILQLYKKRNKEFEVLYNDEYLDLNPLGIISEKKMNDLCAASKFEEIVVLPNFKDIDSNNLFVCSKSTKEIFQSVNSHIAQNLIELPGKIDKWGIIQEDLKESEINPVLRQVFSLKPKHLFISLTNSVLNPNHEKSISNLLKGAGFRITRSFDFC